MASDFKANYQEVMIGPKRSRGRRSNLFKGMTLPHMYDAGRSIPNAKWKDLKSLFHLMPSDAVAFYKALKPAADNVAADDDAADDNLDLDNDME